jgi:hypothetical protein
MRIRASDPRDLVVLIQKLQSLVDMAYLTRGEAVLAIKSTRTFRTRSAEN